MKSVLALIAAAAMIAAALYVRDVGGDGGRGAGADRDEPLRLICVTELEVPCRQLEDEGVEVDVEAAGTTAARLASDEPPDVDGWFTLEPWPQMVREARERQALDALLQPPIAVGRSPLVLAVWEERARVLEAECGELSWRCVGRHAGQPWSRLGGEPGWGAVNPGLSDPTASASGLLVLGQAASELLGTPDFSTRDFERPGFAESLARLKRSMPSTGTARVTPLQQMLQRGSAAFDVVGTTEAEAAPELERAAPNRRRDLTLRYPEPIAVAQASLAPLDPQVAERLRELVDTRGKAAVAEAGWRVKGHTAAPGVGGNQLPGESTLPAAGVLEALRARWGEAR